MSAYGRYAGTNSSSCGLLRRLRHLVVSTATNASARHASGVGDRRIGRLSLIVLIAVGFLLASGGAAWAYLVTTSSGTYGLAKAGHIAPPAAFTASSSFPNTATLSWTAPTNPSPTGYTLTQSPGTLAGTCASLSGSSVSCNATGLTQGTKYTWTLKAKDDTWSSTAAVATTTTVTPSITLVPTHGYKGTTDSISGSGFAASKSISATFNGAAVALSGTTSTNGSGSFSGATFTVPNLTPGPFTVKVTDAASNFATATYTVSATFGMTKVDFNTSKGKSVSDSKTKTVTLVKTAVYLIYVARTAGSTSTTTPSVTHPGFSTPSLVATNTLGDSASHQWAWVATATATKGKVTVTFTNTLGTGNKKNLLELVRLSGVTPSSPLATSGAVTSRNTPASTKLTANGDAVPGDDEGLLLYVANKSGATAPSWTSTSAFSTVDFEHNGSTGGWGFQAGNFKPSVATASTTFTTTSFAGSVALTFNPDPKTTPATTATGPVTSPPLSGIQFVPTSGGTAASPPCTQSGTASTCTISGLTTGTVTGSIELYTGSYPGSPFAEAEGTITVPATLVSGATGGSASSARITDGMTAATVTIVSTGPQTWTYHITIDGTMYTCTLNVS